MYIIIKKVPFLSYPLYVGNPAVTNSKYSFKPQNAKRFNTRLYASFYKLTRRLTGVIVREDIAN